MQKQLFAFILALLALLVRVPSADSMSSHASFPGNHPISQSDWPFGEKALKLANLESRVDCSYPLRGPDSPPSIRHRFYYRFSNAEELNEALKIFSSIASATLEFVIHDYPNRWRQADWTFSIGSDFPSGTPGAFGVGEPLPPYVEHPPRISVYEPFWNNVRDEVEIPVNIKFIDRRRGSEPTKEQHIVIPPAETPLTSIFIQLEAEGENSKEGALLWLLRQNAAADLGNISYPKNSIRIHVDRIREVEAGEITWRLVECRYIGRQCDFTGDGIVCRPVWNVAYLFDDLGRLRDWVSDYAALYLDDLNADGRVELFVQTRSNKSVIMYSYGRGRSRQALRIDEAPAGRKKSICVVGGETRSDGMVKKVEVPGLGTYEWHPGRSQYVKYVPPPAGNRTEILFKRYLSRGNHARNAGRLVLAEAYFRDALDLAEQLAPGDRRRIIALRNLAGVLARDGRFAESETLYKQAMGYCEKNPLGDRSSLRGVLSDYARLLEKTGRMQEAQAAKARKEKLLQDWLASSR